MDTPLNIGLNIGLMWRGPADAPPPDPAQSRFHLIFAALQALGARTIPLIEIRWRESVRAEGPCCTGPNGSRMS